MENKRALGSRYEQQAAEYLRNKGYAVLESNFRMRTGEIDLICLSPDRSVYVFVEVKYRSDDATAALEAVNLKKQQQIVRTALRYIHAHPQMADAAMRFDAVGIDSKGCVIHVENAFDAV